MYFHIILTEKCNSQCRYCYEKSLNEFDNKLNKKFKFDYSAPSDSNINMKDLKKFILKDKHPKIIFYGGEPLVNRNKLMQIMDFLPRNIEYFMQTNAKLLHQLPEKYINRFKRILISIDGNKERTDYNRGKGTYDLIVKNIKLIRKNNFKGEIVARMTISQEFPDLYEQVKNLIKTNLFDSMHWQLDAGFYKNDFNKSKFSEFVKKYNNSVSKLIKYWIQQMQKGRVLRLYPFLGIFNDILHNQKTKLRCGSGYANYTITTKGDLTCCPIMNSIKNFYVGNINNSNPDNLKKIYVSKPCDSCGYIDLCGGRCLYSNYAKLWPKQGEKLICNTIKHLIDELKKSAPKIKLLIKNKIISKENFKYEKYFGPEIIP